MTTTAAGDAAVARLNKATEAFEKIITGASNQVVDVPGYGNQPTLAARVDQRLDETTATATAEANRSRDEADRATTQATSAANSVTLSTAEYNKAKTQADRAQSEADRAAQITGLSTVSDAIGLAALPLPDVWAPLSDSLSMITGYGRDVLVGSDVVARMVNFSRNSTATYIGKDGLLKTAAANEPRFEKEGLLIEGQSTNYITTSEGLNQLGAEAGATVVTENGLKLVQYAGAGQLSKDYTTPANAQLTFSFFVKLGESNTKIALQLRDGVGVGRTAYFDIKPTGELGVADTQGVLVASSWKMNSVSKTVFRVSGTISSSDSTVYKIYRYAPVAGETFGSFQLEPLPFASSYIPTAGAAATRAADVCSVPLAGNFVVPATIGCNYNVLSANRLGLAPAQLLGFKASDKGYDGLRVNTSSQPFKLQSLNEFDGGLSPGVTCQLFGTAVFRAANGVRNEFSSGAFGVPTQGDWKGQTLGNTLYIGRVEFSDNGRHLFGHIRNLRIWHRALTDNQIKAVA